MHENSMKAKSMAAAAFVVWAKNVVNAYKISNDIPLKDYEIKDEKK